jgi:hypothetical protein
MKDKTETANSPEPGPAAAELERLRADDATISGEIQTLFAEGTELRENGATLDDLAPINLRLDQLAYQRRVLCRRIDQLELDAENEKHGWTTLQDGSHGKIQPNGKVLSTQTWVSEWTDSDGTVYRETREDQRRRAERHKATALAFQAKVASGRVERAGQRTPAQPLPRRTPQARSPRPSARRAACPTRGPPDDDGESSEPPAPRYCENARCEADISHRPVLARYCDDACQQEAWRDRKTIELLNEIVGTFTERLSCGCDPQRNTLESGHCWQCGKTRGVVTREWVDEKGAPARSFVVTRGLPQRKLKVRPDRELSQKLRKTRGRWDEPAPREEVAA